MKMKVKAFERMLLLPLLFSPLLLYSIILKFHFVMLFKASVRVQTSRSGMAGALGPEHVTAWRGCQVNLFTKQIILEEIVSSVLLQSHCFPWAQVE